jgi:tRNA pseudouridine32 synthase/23S rRNA pseudouridine746 synthase
MHKTNEASLFIPFNSSVEAIDLPKRFNFPFNYTPHPICILAADELQYHIENEAAWNHNFGLKTGQEGIIIGKMFGVLVVKNKEGKLGYLAGFSGKLDGVNHHPKFVPPVFDILKNDGFFRIGEAKVNKVNARIEEIEHDSDYLALLELKKKEQILSNELIADQKLRVKQGKNDRKARRVEAKNQLNDHDFSAYLEELGKESIEEHYAYKDLMNYWKHRIGLIDEKLAHFTNEIEALKEERKIRSASIQQEIFAHYTFLNQAGETKDLNQIFNSTKEIYPPAGAGECAAPKLLQYAFQHGLTPISMGEFWWGESPASEIRKHKQFYPACRSKCEPILGHMLEGMDMDENPRLHPQFVKAELDIIFEDDYLMVINKPCEVLSVPGVNISDSIYTRVKENYPEFTGPLVVHRLDQSTTGLLLIAKTKEIYKILQRQFINRTVKKQYVAILEGVLFSDEGSINLPLRVDLDNRPRQLVCYEHGKTAYTNWKVVDRSNNRTRIHFYPVTGRTHQLRVHAAHPSGLNSPIVGDDLYGNSAERLYLHAEILEFKHPVSQEVMQMKALAPF